MKKFQHFFIMACVLFTAVAVTSCDNEYDLSKDINGEISVGKNFTLPVGQTVQIPLSRIIEEGEDLTCDAQSGIYQLNANGEFESQITKTDPFEIGGLAPHFVEDIIHMPLEQIPGWEEWMWELRKEIPDFSVSTDFKINVNTAAQYEIHETKTKLPSEVKSVYKIEFNGDGKLNSNGHTGAESVIKIFIPAKYTGTEQVDFNGAAGIEEIDLKRVHIKFPEIFTLKDDEAAEDLPHEIYREDIILNKNNNYEYDIHVYIESVEIPDELQSKYIYTENGETYFHLPEGENITLSVEEAYLSASPANLQGRDFVFDFNYEISATNVTRVNGKIVPDVTVDEQLTLSDLPDFIKDESSEFTPNDITFTLELDNPLGLEMTTDISITPYNNSGAITGTPVLISLNENNAIKPNATTKYVISNKAKTVSDGETFILCEELPNLLSPIPDYYKITTGELVADGKKSNGLELGKDYDLKGKYDVEIPFSFSNVKINYSDFVDGLMEDLEDAADLTNKIEVSFDAVSTIPADLTATVRLLDASGCELNEITVTGTDKNTVNIKASTDGNETITPITLTIVEKDGSTQLEELEKLEYTIKATNPIGKDVILKSSQYLMLKNGVAKVPNGITTEL